MSRARIVGLTGGIGSGKSTVSGFAREMGVPVIDADILAREVLEPEGEAFGEVVDEFGEGILDDTGRLDRAALASVVFSDPAARLRLEELTHPHIVARMRRRVEELSAQGENLVILDVPLLYEAGLEEMCDEVWVVFAPESQRIERLELRDGAGMEDIRRRMDAQIPLCDKVERADVVVDNSGSPGETRSRVRDLLRSALCAGGENP